MGRERTVLVVGPGAGRDEALRDTLGEPDWEVDAAGTAAEALSKLASGRYDSVVIDPALLEEPSGEAPTNWAEAVVRKPADAEELLRAAAEGAVGRQRAADQVPEHVPPLDVIASCTRANLAYLDPDFNFLWVNPAYCEKSGYAEEELLGRNHFELFPHEENQAIFERVRDTGVPFEVKEKPFVHPSQPERGVTYWDWTLTPVKDESGAVRGLVLSSVDVTERKLAEEAVRTERDRLTSVFDSMADGVYIVNQQYEIEYVNPALEREFGAVGGRKCYQYFHGCKEPCPFCKNAEVFAGKTIRWEWYSPRSQKTYDLMDTPLRNPDGSMSKLEILRDITERKRAEEAVRKSEEEYRRIVETAHEGIWVIDKDSKTTFANQKMAEMLGYNADEMLGMSLFELMDDEARAAAEAYVDRRKQGIEEDHDFKFRCKDGTELWTIVSTSPILDREGNYAGAMGMITDVTERKQAEEALEDAALFPSENPNPVMRIAKDGTILFANRSSENLLDSWDVQTGQRVPSYLRRSVADTLKSGSSTEVEIEHEDRAYSFVLAPVVGNDYVNLYGRDVTERKRAEEALSWEAEVDAAVAELSEALMSKSSIEDISAMVLDHAQRLTGSKFGFVGYIDPNTGFLIDTAITEDIWDVCRVPRQELVFKEFRGLWGWVLNNREPLLTNSPADDPRSSGVPEGHVPIHQFLSAPALAGDDLLGQLALGNAGRDYTARDMAVAKRLASIYALAVQRARTEEALEDAALFPSEDPNPVMRVAKDGTILFANRSSEDLLDSWGVQTGQRVPSYLRRSVADTLKSGTSREVEIEHRDKIFSFVLEPIVDNDYVTLYGRDVTERRRAQKELAEARDTLQRLYDREHHIADVLQRAMVPEVTIEIPGYGLAARYEPALEEAAVGGDFYDVFELADGRVALVVGDVSGKGLKAAVHTATAKYMLRAFAHENPDPAYVMNHLNAAMFDYAGEEAFVTMFYGVLDAGGRTLVYANGGHEPPLHYSQQIRWVLPLDVTGRAVAIFRESSYAVATLTLAPDDVLLVYTDGITEARTGDQFLGEEGLAEVLMANADRDEQGIVVAVLDAASKASEGKLQDDAAVLVLKATFDSD